MESYSIIRKILSYNFSGNLRWWHLLMTPVVMLFPVIDRVDALFGVDLQLQEGYLDVVLWIIGGFVVTMIWDLSDDKPGSPGLIAQLFLLPAMACVVYLYSETLNPQKVPTKATEKINSEKNTKDIFKDDRIQDLPL